MSETDRRRLAAAALGSLLFAGALRGADPGTVRVVAPREVGELSRLAILDVRDSPAFRAGHLAGARHFDWRDWTEERPGVWSALLGRAPRWGLILVNSPDLAARLGALGFAPGRPVLVVGAGGGWGEEGRAAWDALVWGASEAWLLDGGFAAWRRAELPVERGEERPPVASGRFAIQLRPERRIRLEELARGVESGDLQLLDARTPAEFTGERLAGQRRGGHLPGARLVPEAALFRSDGTFLDAAALRALAGPLDGRPVVTYCTGGVRAALLAMLLEARIGVVARNDDGSMWEWSADPALPLSSAAR